LHYTFVESQGRPLTAQERERIREAILDLLETDAEFRTRVFQLVVPAELRQILDEIRQFRLDFKTYSEAQDKRFEALISEMNRRFEEVDKRFEEVNRRFEEVDKRFEALISEMNRRFEEVDKRFEALISEMNRRFEEVDKRFEALISEMNRRFEEVDKRFEALISEMNRRFEEVDKRFEALISEMNRRFEEVDKRFEEMDKRFEAILEQIREIRVELAGLGGRLGRGFEDLVRQTLKAVVGAEVKEVKRLIMWDEKGEVYGHPENVEFDAYASNSEKFLIEVKSSANKGDVLIFNKKAEWAEKTLGKTRKILIAAYVEDAAYRECIQLGITVISRNIVPREKEEDTLRL